METVKRALLLAKMDPPPDYEEEWNEWYSNSHCAARLRLPGFLSGRRFIKVEGVPRDTCIPNESKYLALYDLSDVNVLNSEAYQKLREKELARGPDGFDAQIFNLSKFVRAAYKQIFPETGDYAVPPAKFVFVVGHDVPADKDAEYNAWYNTEHIPALLKVPGFLTARRFVLEDRLVKPIASRGGTLSKYLTVYDLNDGRGFESEAYSKASNSPWTHWVRSWYTRRVCTMFEKIYPPDAKGGRAC